MSEDIGDTEESIDGRTTQINHTHPPSLQLVDGCQRCTQHGNFFAGCGGPIQGTAHAVQRGNCVHLRLMNGSYRVMEIKAQHMTVEHADNPHIKFRALYSEVTALDHSQTVQVGQLPAGDVKQNGDR